MILRIIWLASNANHLHFYWLVLLTYCALFRKPIVEPPYCREENSQPFFIFHAPLLTFISYASLKITAYHFCYTFT